MNLLIQIKENLANTFVSIIFIFSTLFTFVLGELFFYTPNGVDHIYHSKYLSYFLNLSENTYTGFGLIYYYIIALVSHLRIDEVNNLNAVHFMNSSIHTANFLLYLLGIIGIYYLLRKNLFSKTTILIALTLNNFLIPVFIMRSILKPEIFAFSLFPWIILGLDKYFKLNSLKNFLLVVIPLSVMLTIKGSVTGMIIIILLIRYSKYLKTNFKKHLLCFFILVFCFSLISLETNNVNDFNLLEHNFTGVDDKYNNKADTKFLFNINGWDMIFNPVFPYHNNSLISITLLDTFGDYFNVFIDYEEHLFIYDINHEYTNNLNYNKSFNYGKYLVHYLGVFLAIIFYSLAIFFSAKDKKYLEFYLGPIVGIFILSVSSFGFPFNHFDPNTGDTLKSNYYSFLIAVSFIFIVVKLFKKINLLNFFISLLLIFIFFFSLGFPKSENSEINFFLEEKIEVSLACEVISIFLKNTDFNDCNNKVKKTCDYNIYSNSAKNFLNIEKNNLSLNKDNPLLFEGSDEKLTKVTSSNVCEKYIEDGVQLYNPVSKGLRSLPPINMIYLLLTLFSITYYFYDLNSKK
tara:strand:- start:3366 stop:5087 length:1722 start_codon:yes stop_codon:yes gene_type:complete